MALSKKDRRYILREHPDRSVKELARELGVKPKEVREALTAAGRLSESSLEEGQGSERPLLGYTPVRLLGVMMIVAVVSVVFLNSTRNGFHYDDIHSLTTNPDVRITWSDKSSLKKFYEYFYRPDYFSERPNVAMPRPVLMVTFGLNHLFTGYNPWSWMLVNILLHLFNSIIIYMMLCHLSGRARVALLTALLFAVHPINTETVNYINCRSESLGVFFMLLTVYFFCRSLREDRQVLRIMSFVMFAIGLLTKEMVIVIPALVLAVDYLFIHRDAPEKIPFSRRALSWYLPLVIISVAYMFYRQVVLDTLVVDRVVRPFADNLVMQARVLMTYIRLLFYPLHLNVSYEIVDFGVKDLFGSSKPLWERASYWASFGVLGGLAALAVFFRRRLPLISLAIAGFFITLSVTSLIPLNAVMNEHRLYLPSLIVCLLLAFGLARVADLLRERREAAAPGWPLSVQVLSVAALLLFSSLTVARNFTWHTDLTVWRDAIRKSPEKAQVVCDLGNVYYRTGQKLDRHRGEFRQRPAPGDPESSSTAVLTREARLVIAETFYVDVEEGPISPETARLLDELQMKGLARAEQLYLWGGRVEPYYYKAWHNLGTINYTYAFLRHRDRNNEEARKYFGRAAKFFFRAATYIRYEGEDFEDLLLAWDYVVNTPNRPPFSAGESFNDMASTLQQWSALEPDEDRKRAMLEMALTFYEMAFQLHPGLVKAYINQARTLDALGRSREALPRYQQLIQSFPGDASLRYFMGLSLLQTKRFSEAGRSFQDCLRLEPDNVECARSLQMISELMAVYDERIGRVQELLRNNQPESAINICQELTRLSRGRVPEPYYYLGRALEMIGNLSEAEKGYRRCLELDQGMMDCERALANLDSQRGLYRQYLEEGRSLYDQGRRQESARQLFRALELDRGGDPEVYLLLALNFIELGDHREARQAVQGCLSIAADHAGCLEVRAELERALSADGSYQRHLEQGRRFEQAGDHRGALAEYERAAALSSGREAAEAHYLRGRALLGLSRPGDAVSAFGECLELVPDHPECRPALERQETKPAPP